MTAQTYTDAQVQSIIDKVTRENSADGMDGDSWDRLLVRAALADRQASRSVVVSDEDVSVAVKAFCEAPGFYEPDSVTGWKNMRETMRTALEYFAQSHGVAGARRVPDARALHVRDASKDEPQFDPEDYTQVDTRVYFWRVGWNACRSSMLEVATQEKAS